MTKKLNIGIKPSRRPASLTPEHWVKNRHASPEEPKQRFTAEIPVRLHSAFKADCAQRGIKMVTELVEILEKRYGQNGR